MRKRSYIHPVFQYNMTYIPVTSNDTTLSALIPLFHMTSTYIKYYTTLQLYSIPQEERKHHTILSSLGILIRRFKVGL